MPSRPLQLADAVVTLLNLGSFSVAVAAERKYLTTEAVRTLKDLAVAVRPLTFSEGEQITRETREGLTGIVIIIAKKLDPTDTAAVDELIDLEMGIRTALIEAGRIAGAKVEEVSVGGAANELYDPEYLLNARTFIGAVTVTLNDF